MLAQDYKPMAEAAGSGVLLGVLVSPSITRKFARGESSFHPEMLARAGRYLEVTVYAFQAQKADAETGSIAGWTWNSGQWCRSVFPWPTVYYDQAKGLPRSRRQRRNLQQLRRDLSATAIPINRAIALPKWQSHRILSSEKQTASLLPETRLCAVREDLSTMLARHSSVLVKPNGGSYGRGIYRVWQASADGEVSMRSSVSECCPETGSLDQVFHRLVAKAPKEMMILQHQVQLLTVSENRACDFRVMVNKDGKGIWRVSQSYMRIGRPGAFVLNWHQGADFVTVRQGLEMAGYGDRAESLVWRMNQAAILVANTLEREIGRMGEMGMDFGIDTEAKLWFFEANARPDKGNVADDIWEPVPHIFRYVIEYARFLHTRTNHVSKLEK